MNNAKRAKVCEFLLPYHHREWWHLPCLLCSDCFGALVRAERRLRERGIWSCDSESGFVADGIYVGQDWIFLTQILGEGFACSLPDVPLSDKSIEATSHMCLGVGKVFLCHWTLDQRGVKDCLCPFSIARGWQRPEEAPASSPFSGTAFPFTSPAPKADLSIPCPSLLRLGQFVIAFWV